MNTKNALAFEMALIFMRF